MRRPVLLLLATLAPLAAAGCGSSGSSSSSSSSSAAPPASSTPATTSSAAATPAAGASAKSGSVAIRYQNISISPDNITVKVGSKITWTNYDSTPHNVTSTSGPQSITSSDFSMNGHFTLTVNKVGVIHYICSIHPASMIGTITVVK